MNSKFVLSVKFFLFLLLGFPFLSNAEESVYWIVKDGSLNSSYTVTNDAKYIDDEDTISASPENDDWMTFDVEAPDGSNAALYTHRKQSEILRFDLSKAPIDLSKAWILCVEYMLPKELTDMIAEQADPFVVTDQDSPLLRISLMDEQGELGFHPIGSESIIQLHGLSDPKAGLYKKEYRYIYTAPSVTEVTEMDLTGFPDYMTYEAMRFYIKNIFVCSAGEKPFMAEDFEYAEIWNMTTKGHTNMSTHSGYHFYGKKKTCNTYRTWREDNVSTQSFDPEGKYLCDEILHGLEVEDTLHTEQIEIPKDAENIYVRALMRDRVELLESVNNISDRSGEAVLMFDDGTNVPLFPNTPMLSAWKDMTNIIPVPSQAKSFELRLNSSQVPFLLDNLRFSTSEILDFPGDTFPTPVAYPTDTIPADTIPQDTVPAVVPDTTLTLGVTDTFTYKLESGHILYCIAREDGSAKVYDIEGDGEVVIPENVFLEEKKFSVTEILVHGHYGLTQVTVPSSVLFHQDSLFVDCKRLKKVVVPNNCVRFPKDAFFGCDSLEVIAFGGTLKEWCEVSRSRWRVCLDSVKFVLKNHPIDVEVEGIVLRTVESIIIPEGVETIASCAFEDCDSLRSLILPKTLRKIEAWAFNSCSKLSLVEFPENLVEIEKSAFMDCDNLSRIVCLANVPDIKDGERFQCTFTSYDADLFVPCEYLSSFKEHAVWGKFKNIYCAGADSVRLDEQTGGFKATIDDMTATVTWEQVDSAVVYTLTVYKQDSVYCVVQFDENGTVMSLDLNELRSLKQGFSYKLTDLEGNMADYTYKFTAVGKDSNVLKEFKGEFAPTNGVEDYQNGQDVALSLYVADDAIVVECASEMDVRIQNMLGQILYQGAGSVSFQTPAKGVYLVGCGAKTYKVIVR